MYPSLSNLLSQLVTVSVAARTLKVCEQMVRHLADNGSLPCMVIGGRRLFHPRDVDALRTEREVRQLMTGHKRRGPKSAYRSVKFEHTAIAVEEAAVA